MDLSVRYIVFHQIQDDIEFKLWEKIFFSIFLAIIFVLAFVVHRRIIAFLNRHKGKRWNQISSAWIRGGAGGACAPPEFSGSSTKHSNVPPRNFEDYLEIPCFKQKCPPGIRSLIQALIRDFFSTLAIKPHNIWTSWIDLEVTKKIFETLPTRNNFLKSLYKNLLDLIH